MNDNVSTTRSCGRDPRLRRQHRRAGLELGCRQSRANGAARARRDIHRELAQHVVDRQRRRGAGAGLRAARQRLRPTSSAETAVRMSSALAHRSRRSTSRPARSAGSSRPCTTICGTTTCRRSRAWSTSQIGGADGAGAGPADQAGRSLCARPADRRAGAAGDARQPRPQGAVAGDFTAPTQPVSASPSLPPPLTGPRHVGRNACSTS